MHDSFLQRYLATGDGRFVDMSRIMFGKHRSGTIFPLLLSVREGNTDDGPPSFIGLMRPLTTPDHYMLMNDSMRVTAADAQSLTALGLDAVAITEGNYSIRVRDC